MVMKSDIQRLSSLLFRLLCLSVFVNKNYFQFIQVEFEVEGLVNRDLRRRKYWSREGHSPLGISLEYP